MSTVVLYCWCHSDSASVVLYFTLYTNYKHVKLNIIKIHDYHEHTFDNLNKKINIADKMLLCTGEK